MWGGLGRWGSKTVKPKEEVKKRGGGGIRREEARAGQSFVERRVGYVMCDYAKRPL